MSKAQRSKIHGLVPSEDQDQAKLCVWMTKLGIKHYAIPNGGKRHYLEAVRLKAQGVQSGVPDLCIPIPSGSYHGLYIELKRVRGGKLSDNQVYWLEFLRNHGYYAECAHGFDEAKEMIEHYLSLTKPAA